LVWVVIVLHFVKEGVFIKPLLQASSLIQFQVDAFDGLMRAELTVVVVLTCFLIF
jgi:hypothetical protein